MASCAVSAAVVLFMATAYHAAMLAETSNAAQYAVPVILGICLAAATGFRVFIPLLILGLGARADYIPVSDGLAWVTTTPALIMLAIAAAAEILAYYIPGVDNLLDTLATPAAVAAGIGISAAVMTDLPPMLKWTLAIIAGGGAAAMTQTTTAALRGTSTAVTGGLGNPVLATGELLAAIAVPLMALIWPYAALLLTVILLVVIVRLWRRMLRRRSGTPA